MTLPIILLLTVALDPCAPSDLACTARASAREARAATDPGERAEALLTAARARLGLYRKTGARAELCSARRLVRALPRGHTGDLGDLPRATRAEIEAELARLGHDCKPRSQRSAPTVAATAVSLANDLPEKGAASTALESAAPSPASSEAPASPITSAPPEPLAAGPSSDEPEDALIDVGRNWTPAVRVPPPATATDATVAPLVAPRRVRPGVAPGRGLIVAGTALMGGAATASGLAAYAAVRAGQVESQQTALAIGTHAQGFTTPDMSEDSQELTAEAAHWRRFMVGASIAGAALGGTAVALITAGAVKRRRTTRLGVALGFRGLLLHGRF